MARVMADMIALRTAAIDQSVREAIAGGATQLVILGAGYDGRAWRLPELAGVKVFEVDHPATQGEIHPAAQCSPHSVHLDGIRAIHHCQGQESERDFGFATPS
jgi:hypothetical protein